MNALDRDAALVNRVVEVLYNRGDDTAPRWSVGSGFVVRSGIVLSAAHVVGTSGTVAVRFRGTEEWPARVLRLAGGELAFDERVDLAILEIIGDVGPVGPIAIARLVENATLGMPNLDGCSAFGFPRFQEKRRDDRAKPVRESVRIDGYIPMGEGLVEGTATLRIRDAPHDIPIPAGGLGGSLWEGISGSVVLAGGFAVGVISEHHRPAGANALTVVPLSWVDRCVDGREWWAALGVTDAATLPSLPMPDGLEGTVGDLLPSDAEVVYRFRQLLLQVPDFAKLSTPFGGLSADFYLPRLLRPVSSAGRAAGVTEEPILSAGEVLSDVSRVVVIAGAGMGKTELLHDAVRRMAAEEYEGIPLFVRLSDFARRGEGRGVLAFAVDELFGHLLDREELDHIVAVLHRRPGPGDAVVFLFDGLDEVPVSQQEDVLAQVRRMRRFVMTSRPMGPIHALQDRTFQMEELTDQAVAEFIERWADREPGVRELTDRVTQDSRLGELSRLPQLLLLLCWLWKPTPAGTSGNRIEILAGAVDEAFNRAVRLARLAAGDEDVVPSRARRALRRAALSSIETSDGRERTLTREYLLDLMGEAGGAESAGRLLAFARRSGLVVVADGPGRELQFVHHAFLAFLAGEALALDPAPADAIDRLRRKPIAEDALCVAAALDPTRIPALILDRVAADDQDIFGLDWRVAALCVEGLADTSRLQERLRPVADAVLAAAGEWWSRDRFAPVVGSLRTTYMWNRLLEDLAHEDGYARWAAVEGLRYFGDPRAASALIERLDHETWPPVVDAILAALGHFRDRTAIDPIWAYYERRRSIGADTDLYAVGEVLARLGAEPQLRLLIQRFPGESSVSDALFGALPFASPQLADDIGDALAAGGITSSRPHAQERYRAILQDETATIAQILHGIDGLGALGTDDAIVTLLDVLVGRPEEVVRDRAAIALTTLTDGPDLRDVVENIVGRFLTPDPATRELAAREFLALWASSAEDSMAELTFNLDASFDDLLGDADPPVRAAAALMAALCGAPPTALVLELLGSADPVLRRAAIAVAGRAGVAEAADPIAALIRADDRTVRIVAVRALTRLAPPGLPDLLAEVLRAPDPLERTAAVRAMAVLGDPSAIDLLAERLGEEQDSDVRISLIRAMNELRGAERLPASAEHAILAGMDDPDPWARAHAANAAARAHLTDAADRLRQLLVSDPDRDVRSEAAEAFGLLADADALAALVDEMVVDGFGDRLEAVATAIAGRDEEVVDRLRASIAATGGQSLVSYRAAVVKYPGHTYNVMYAAEPRSRQELVAALSDPDPGLRWAAVDELADAWDEAGMLGHLALAMLDDNWCVADHAASVLGKLAREYQLRQLDAESSALMLQPDNLPRLIGLLDSDDSAPAARWFLAQAEFVPGLLRAHAAGQRSVRAVLWDFADRYELRIFADGRVLLATGDVVSGEEIAASLR